MPLSPPRQDREQDNQQNIQDNTTLKNQPENNF